MHDNDDTLKQGIKECKTKECMAISCMTVSTEKGMHKNNRSEGQELTDSRH